MRECSRISPRCRPHRSRQGPRPPLTFARERSQETSVLHRQGNRSSKGAMVSGRRAPAQPSSSCIPAVLAVRVLFVPDYASRSSPLRLKIPLCAFILVTLMTTARAQETERKTLVDRVGQTGFIQLYADSFKDVPLKEKIVAYWLSMAAIAINPIVYGQNAAYGLRQKRLLEEILRHPKGIDPQVLKKITDYTKLFWANRGNRNIFTSQKFLPDFTFEELKAAAEQALKNRASLGPKVKLDQELEELR